MTLKEYTNQARLAICREVYYRRNENLTAAARELEVSRTTLYRILFPNGKNPGAKC